MKQIPVYLVTGFLESGKTTFVNDTMKDKRFTVGEKVLVITGEEGEEEYGDFEVEYIDSPEKLTVDRLSALQKRHKATKILIEYNGMWQLAPLFENAPENWVIGQNILFFDSETFEVYNKNMRSLVVDKIQNADLIIFNRVDNVDVMMLHKAVRAVSRNLNVIYETKSGETTPDEIEDPLPYDKDKNKIEIEDRDYAYFYRDLGDDMESYDGKTVKLKAMLAQDKGLGTGTMFVGRYIMICCEEDIEYRPLVCKYGRSEELRNGEWVLVEARVKLMRHKAYDSIGPVLIANSVTKVSPPSDPVATFY